MSPKMVKPLKGVKVVSFCWRLAGPVTNVILAAYGATVIKIESATRMDPQRASGPFIDNISTSDRSVGFLFINPGKLGATLNLKHPKAMLVIERLIKWADVVVENFAGRKMVEMGLGYDVLRKIKPNIIMLSASIYGQTGAFATVPGYGVLLTAATGFPHVTGYPDQRPELPGFAFTDYVAMRANALAILGALEYKRRTGKGQYIDASQMEASIPLLTPLILEYEANGTESKRIGNRSTYAAPHGVYRCKGKDRWCAITVFSDEDWQNFCQSIGQLPWTQDPEFTTLLGRLKHVDRLDRLVEEWTVNHSAEEVMDIMQKAEVAAGVVEDGEDLDKDIQLKSRHFYWDLEHPEIGRFTYSGMPVIMSKTPYEINPAPGLGEHNEHVYTKLLDMPDEEFVQLLKDGVFE